MMETEEVIEFDLDPEQTGPPPKVLEKHVRPGSVVQFNSISNTVWIVIPSQYFEPAGGGSDWAVGKEMISFKIDHGIARAKLSEAFPKSPNEQIVTYSILFFNGDRYYYQEGNSPPRMIIPPTGI